MPTRQLVSVFVLALSACADQPHPNPPEPVPPSAAAKFRGYAAVQDDLYYRFLDPSSDFELFRYLGDDGEQLSNLVGRPNGFGTTFDTRTNKPNSMNVLVWRMMLSRFANDIAAACPGSPLTALAMPPIAISSQALLITSALCAWPAVGDEALAAAWNLLLDSRAPAASRDAWIALARSPELQAMPADKALPTLWVAAFLHPTFLLEQ